MKVWGKIISTPITSKKKYYTFIDISFYKRHLVLENQK